MTNGQSSLLVTTFIRSPRKKPLKGKKHHNLQLQYYVFTRSQSKDMKKKRGLGVVRCYSLAKLQKTGRGKTREELERDRQTDRDRERQREKETETETERDRDRDTTDNLLFTKKGSKLLHILRVLRCSLIPANELLKVYLSLIRPVLEYCCPVWHPNLPIYITTYQIGSSACKRGPSELFTQP